MVLLSDQVYPLIRVTYGGKDEFRGSEDIDAEQFIAVKSFRAKGKRISTYEIESISELEPVRFPEEPAEEEIPEVTEDSETSETQKTSEVPETPDSSEPLQLSLDF